MEKYRVKADMQVRYNGIVYPAKSNILMKAADAANIMGSLEPRIDEVPAVVVEKKEEEKPEAPVVEDKKAEAPKTSTSKDDSKNKSKNKEK